MDMYFYKPTYLVDDCDNMLESLGTELTLNYDEATPTTFNGLLTKLKTSVNFKGVTDSTMDAVVPLDLSIQKGDYINDNNGNIYICMWNIFTDINCKITQVQLCNYSFVIERWIGKIIDSDGNTATPSSYTTIASLYGYISRIGQSNFDSREGQVGLSGTQKVCVGMKYNDDSSNIQIHDEFDYYNQRYEIIDIDYTQMNDDHISGLIFIYAQIKSGGENTIT